MEMREQDSVGNPDPRRRNRPSPTHKVPDAMRQYGVCEQCRSTVVNLDGCVTPPRHSVMIRSAFGHEVYHSRNRADPHGYGGRLWCGGWASSTQS